MAKMNEAELFEAIGKACETTPNRFGASGPVGSVGSTVAEVLKAVRPLTSGFADTLEWLPIILKLITELGPIVLDIIQKIKDAIDGGKTPQTFYGP